MATEPTFWEKVMRAVNRIGDSVIVPDEALRIADEQMELHQFLDQLERHTGREIGRRRRPRHA